MKIVVVTLALVFFTGSECRFLWMKDEPKPEPGTLETFVNNVKILGEHYVHYLENTEIGKELQLNKDLVTMRDSIYDLKKELEKISKDFWEELDKELNEKYPVFRTKVVPALKDFKLRWNEHMEQLGKDIAEMSHKLIFNVKTNVERFLDTLSASATSGRDKLRSEVESLRATLLPYVDELQKELEKARKEMDDDVDEIRKYINKEVDAIREHTKPYFENLKSEANPHAEELQKYLLKLLDDIKAAFVEKA
ncbi:uncharacterized protein LOC379735 precursor [Xenopus laevis]|uniref:MGC68522 protein n=2 Tax=Xenopus laevis TaxID=8355 RepID=Q6PBB8_XENLA|nr:uncharacterized protein LOC379735 precursor [Xenopus laevis]AAH59786.1 MGC68522 protein [Xenopus laevis]OCT72483.1 hypothetical protein XELAEV_18035463mg [Xenopus laevis]